MNDDVRFGLMTLITAIFAGVVAFGVDFSPEASAAAVAIAAATVNLIAKIWKTGQGVDAATAVPLPQHQEAVAAAAALPAPSQIVVNADDIATISRNAVHEYLLQTGAIQA